MSDYKNKKAKTHKVELIFSGKSHFFKVTNLNNVSYDTSIQMSCTCEYMSVVGIANGKMCSHLLAVFKKILDVEEKNVN